MADIKLKTVTPVALIESSSTVTSTNFSALSDEYDNATNLYPFAIFEIYLAFQVAPTVGRKIFLYLVPCIDGTNYAETPIANVEHSLIGYISVLATTNQQRHVFMSLDGRSEILIPPSKFKVCIKNDADQTIDDDPGWDVTIAPYHWQSA